MSTSTDESAPRWAQWLAQNTPVLTRSLLLLAAACTAIPVGVAIAYRGEALGPVLIWGICLSLVFFGAAILSFAYYPEGVSQTERVRLLLMVSLGLAGFFTALLGFVLPLTTYWGVLTDISGWRDKSYELLWMVLATVSGLAIMSVSLALVSGMERGNQFVRWLVYGFNAVLGTLLLACVLAVLNVLVYMDPVDQAFNRVFSRDFDFTRTSMYTLSPRTEAFLASMDERVKAYVMMARQSDLQEDLETLMRNCQARNPNFRFEMLIADTPKGRARIGELMKKYGAENNGVLLISGDEAGKHDSEFVPLRRMVTEKFDRDRRDQQEVFTGENALLAGLTSLLEGKVTVYFSQGHGEMSMTAHGMGARPGEPPSATMAALKEGLEKTRSKMSVLPLPLGPGGKKAVPDDASVLVIARPMQRWTKDELKVLSDYLARKEKRSGGKVTVTAGRIIFLLPPIVVREGGSSKLLKTGLEEFLAGFGVKVGDDRVQSLSGEDVLAPLCTTNPGSKCPVGRAFFQLPQSVTRFRLRNVRTVAPAQGGRFAADPLMMAWPVFWVETNFSRNPEAAATALQLGVKLDGVEEVTDQQAPVAVAVTEQAGMGRFGAAETGRPVMVVFGASDWVSDAGLRGAEATNHLNLFASCMSWVREQSDIGELVPPKQFGDYKLVVPDDAGWRLIFMPLVLMSLGVIALGIGVWVVRRS